MAEARTAFNCRDDLASDLSMDISRSRSRLYVPRYWRTSMRQHMRQDLAQPGDAFRVRASPKLGGRPPRLHQWSAERRRRYRICLAGGYPPASAQSATTTDETAPASHRSARHSPASSWSFDEQFDKLEPPRELPQRELVDQDYLKQIPERNKCGSFVSDSRCLAVLGLLN